MRFEDERYVRVYTRDTTNWLLLPWEARTVLLHLFRKLDRAGLLDLGEHDVVAAVGAQCNGLPADIVERGLTALFENKTLVYRKDLAVICAPNFLPAQEAHQSNRARQQAYRERARAVARLRTLGMEDIVLGGADLEPEDDDESVTQRYEESHGVTGAESAHVTPRYDLSHGVTDGAKFAPVTQRYEESHGVTPRGDKTPDDITPRYDLSRGVTDRNAGKHRVTPSLAVPSRSPDPICKVDPTLPSSSADPSRARARGSDARRTLSLDSVHPDEAMVDRTADVEARLFVPDQFVVAQARADGMTDPEITSVLADYRARAKPPVRSQYQHDKAFQGFLRVALKNQKAARARGGHGENTQGSNGAGNGARGGNRKAGPVTLGGMDRSGPLHQAGTQRRFRRKSSPDDGAAK